MSGLSRAESCELLRDLVSADPASRTGHHAAARNDKGDGVVLRSKTPDGAEQELWALLCAYHAIRELICAAAELTDQDPLRLSFIAALDAVRGPVGDPAAFPP